MRSAGGQRSRWLVGAVIAAFVLLAAAPADATWSVVGVDPDSGEVGVAVASCVELGALDFEDGFELIALSPGVGAGVTQAHFNPLARNAIHRLLDAGVGADEIIEAVSGDVEFDSNAQDRQHGVVLLSGEAAGFTGERNSGVALDVQGVNVSGQGNILVGRAVIDDAIDAFEVRAGRPLADRLVAALEAGSLAGGDSRCDDQTALFAHVSVVDADGASFEPNVVEITMWAERGDGGNPVLELAALYRSGARFLTPDAGEVPGPTLPIWVWLSLAAFVALLLGALELLRRALKSRFGTS